MKDKFVVDCEVYRNYFLAAFKGLKTGKVYTIEARGEDSSLKLEDNKLLRSIMCSRETFGFNTINYDIPIILQALRGKSCIYIKEMSDYIIENNSRGWQTLMHYGLAIPAQLNNFDIAEVAPGVKISLKLYGARLHSKRLQDLPYDPATILTEKEMDAVKLYCINDLDTTLDLYHKIEERIALRTEMSKRYGINLMSKSDAQIAEAVIKTELSKKLSAKIKVPKIPEGTLFSYEVPSYIKFETQQLKDTLEFIRNHKFELSPKGSIKLPDELKKMKIKIGKSIYQMGIGGLHSTEKSKPIIPNEYQYLIDKDVEAYYPRIILNLGLYPKHLGEEFLEVYDNIVKERVKAKKEKNKVVNESFKIVINGSFGKFGNKYSALYSPDLMMAVTLTGQLSLLMVIERLEQHGISVVSANTDGFVSLVEADDYDIYQKICGEWEINTRFTLEETQYKALYSRDVNNYLAIKEDGTHKGKGVFTLGEIQKNPSGDISTIAVIEYLTNGTAIYDTIMKCKDIRQFIHVKAVTGGALWNEEYLGKVVRWIYVKGGDTIYRKKDYGTYKIVGERWTKTKMIPGVYTLIQHKVSKSDGSRPMMEIGDFPRDLDYGRYIEDSMLIMDTLGLNKGL